MDNPDYRRWQEDGRDWFIQGHDSCCFVYAVANVLIAQDCIVTDEQIKQACDIGCCKTGSVIGQEKVVQFFNASLVQTEYPEEVLQRGGILNIWHPIFNGHSVYIDHECNDKGTLRLINSLIGGPIALNIGQREIRPYITNRCGEHWVLKENKPITKTAGLPKMLTKIDPDTGEKYSECPTCHAVYPEWNDDI